MKNVEIYTGPFCAYCDRAKALKKTNGMRTIPQIFIDGHHIGGNDKLQALENEGKLNSLLGV